MSTTFTATLPDGTTATRKSEAKAYTHCVAVPSVKGGWFAHSWSSRLNLAQGIACRIQGAKVVDAVVTHITTSAGVMTKSEAAAILRAAGRPMTHYLVAPRQYLVAQIGGNLDDRETCDLMTIGDVRALAATLR